MTSVYKTSSFYFILTLMKVLPLISGLSFWQLNEEVKKSNCSLAGAMLLTYYVIKCPATYKKLNIVLGPGNMTRIKCFDLEYYEFKKILPNLKMGAITTIEIKDCPLPDHESISTIMQQLGILNFKNLIFSNKNELGKNLSQINFSTLDTVRNLTIVLDSLKTIPHDLFNDISLTNLKYLDFYSNISQLSNNALMNLQNIEMLALGKNLNLLANNSFHYQNNIRALYLSNNKLKKLEKVHFQYSSSLLSLDLKNNLIEVLPPDIFATLFNLTRLNLSGNRFITLPQTLLTNNKKLTEFILSHNQLSLKILPSRLLADFPYLRDIDLQQCGLQQLPTNLFHNSKNIVLLTLAGNMLTELPEQIFESQQHMKYLNLSNNHLQQLSENLFKNSTDLEIVNLSDNNLTEFSSDFFKSCGKLITLLYNNNKLTTHNIHITFPFRFHQNLKTLSFRNNLITSIPRDWTVPYFLETFDLSHNNITILSDMDLINLITYNLQLIVNHNQITTVYLQNITATNKYFQEQLLKVDLHYNPLNCDCRLLSFVQVLRDPNKNYNLNENIKFLVKNLTCMEPKLLRGQLVKNLQPTSLVCEYKEKCPSKCVCSLRSFDQLLLVNCSGKNLFEIPDFSSIMEYEPYFKALELDLQYNQLLTLPSAAHKLGYGNVTKLNVANNNIRHIKSYQLPSNLTFLDIRSNNLESLDSDTLMFINDSGVMQMYLSNNPWLCNCDARPLLRFTQSNVQLYKDFSNMTCANMDEPTFFYELQNLCPTEQKLYIFLFILFAIACLLLALYYKYQTEIKIWLYAHNMCLWLVAEDELDQDKVYDAFISYSAKDEDFILDILLPELENGRPSFRLCVHVRDWLVGECIPDQILRSISESKKTIVVLSKNFIESVWAKMEFKAAHQSALSEGRAKVIVIIYEDIDNIESLDDDLQAYLKMNTYLKWGDPWFWQKLRYAMPHVARDHNRLFENVEMQQIDNIR